MFTSEGDWFSFWGHLIIFEGHSGQKSLWMLEESKNYSTCGLDRSHFSS